MWVELNVPQRDPLKFSVSRQPKRSYHRLLSDGKQLLLFLKRIISTMSCTTTDSSSKPKSMNRARGWTAEVENLFRFQQAGYRDELEYTEVKQGASVDRWPETGFVKKLQRRDDTFYYYSRKRECLNRDVHKVKVYLY